MYLLLDNKKIKIKDCKKFKDRLLGLMFKKNIDECLLFKNCNSIHTFFMFDDIDVIFLDDKFNVLKIYKDLKPWKIKYVKGCKSVIELPKNTIKKDIKKIKIVD